MRSAPRGLVTQLPNTCRGHYSQMHTVGPLYMTQNHALILGLAYRQGMQGRSIYYTKQDI